jgi:hypothetical protein
MAMDCTTVVMSELARKKQTSIRQGIYPGFLSIKNSYARCTTFFKRESLPAGYATAISCAVEEHNTPAILLSAPQRDY